jgi:hypothetical protein
VEDGCNECALDVPHGQRGYLARFSERKDREPTLDAYLALGESRERMELEHLVLADVDRDHDEEVVVKYAYAEPPECTYAIVHYELGVLDADSLEGAMSVDIGDDGHGGDGAPDRTAIHRFRDEDDDGDLDLVVRIAAHNPMRCSMRPDGWPDGRPVHDDSYLDWDREDCRFSVSRRVYLYDADTDRYEGAYPADPVVVTGEP